MSCNLLGQSCEGFAKSWAHQAIPPLSKTKYRLHPVSKCVAGFVPRPGHPKLIANVQWLNQNGKGRQQWNSSCLALSSIVKRQSLGLS